MPDLRGLYPPIPTPFDAGRFSEARLRENLQRWAATPLQGYVVLGSNGEAPLLEEDERRAVIAAARKALPAGGRLLIAGTGRESTEAAIRATREAFEAGADAALVGVPHYYKPDYTDEVLERHYRAVADASPGPVLLYSVPQFTGVPLPPAMVKRLASHPRIAGIKDSGGDLANLEALLEAGRGEEFTVLLGSARILAKGILAGAAGGVLAVANVAPHLCHEIVEAAQRGDAERASADNERMLPIAQAVTRGHGIGGLKAALDLLGYHGGDPRPPLPAASPEARREIGSLLRDLGILG